MPKVRRAMLAMLAATLVFAVAGAAADEFTLTKVAETSSTITFTYPQQAGYGYLYSALGTVVSQTNDPTRTQVKFAKNAANDYEVASKVKGTTGHYQPAPLPPPPGDTTAPSAPPNLHVGSSSQTQIVVNWDPSTDNVGVTNYRIYRDGALIGQGPGSSGGLLDQWTDSGRVCGTSYQYGVEAQDAAGNTSSRSLLAASTLACDTPPPPPPPPPSGCPAPTATAATLTPSQFSARATSGAVIDNVTVTGDASVNATNVKVTNATIQGDITFNPGASGSSVCGSTATALFVWGADNIAVTGNTFDGHNQTLGGKMWDEPAGNPPQFITIVGNVFKNQNTGNVDDHSQALYIGYATDVLVANNTFTNNGSTSHIFFTTFGNQFNSQSYPRRVCVRTNVFGATAGAYFDINYHSSVVAAGPTLTQIRIDPDNVMPNGTTNPEFNGDC